MTSPGAPHIYADQQQALDVARALAGHSRRPAGRGSRCHSSPPRRLTPAAP